MTPERDRSDLPQVFVDRLAPGTVALRPRDARHLFRSLRMRPGEAVSLADGAGLRAMGRLGAEAARTVEVVSVIEAVARSPVGVSVAMAPAKGDRLSWAVQKLAELGVDEIVVLRTARSVRAWDGDRAGHALERLRTVAREAAMQSRQSFLAPILGPASLEEVAADGPGVAVVLDPRAGEGLGATLPRDAVAVRLVVGPEGGFAPDELGAMRASGAAVASLGPGILRTETAAVVGAALVLATYGRLG